MKTYKRALQTLLTIACLAIDYGSAQAACTQPHTIDGETKKPLTTNAQELLQKQLLAYQDDVFTLNEQADKRYYPYTRWYTRYGKPSPAHQSTSNSAASTSSIPSKSSSTSSSYNTINASPISSTSSQSTQASNIKNTVISLETTIYTLIGKHLPWALRNDYIGRNAAQCIVNAIENLERIKANKVINQHLNHDAWNEVKQAVAPYIEKIMATTLDQTQINRMENRTQLNDLLSVADRIISNKEAQKLQARLRTLDAGLPKHTKSIQKDLYQTDALGVNKVAFIKSGILKLLTKHINNFEHYTTDDIKSVLTALVITTKQLLDTSSSSPEVREKARDLIREASPYLFGIYRPLLQWYSGRLIKDGGVDVPFETFAQAHDHILRTIHARTVLQEMLMIKQMEILEQQAGKHPLKSLDQDLYLCGKDHNVVDPGIYTSEPDFDEIRKNLITHTNNIASYCGCDQRKICKVLIVMAQNIIAFKDTIRYSWISNFLRKVLPYAPGTIATLINAQLQQLGSEAKAPVAATEHVDEKCEVTTAASSSSSSSAIEHSAIARTGTVQIGPRRPGQMENFIGYVR